MIHSEIENPPCLALLEMSFDCSAPFVFGVVAKDTVSDVVESNVQFASKTLTPNRINLHCSKIFHFKPWLSEYVWHAIGESRPFCRENLFSPKKHLKTAFFCGRIWA